MWSLITEWKAKQSRAAVTDKVQSPPKNICAPLLLKWILNQMLFKRVFFPLTCTCTSSRRWCDLLQSPLDQLLARLWIFIHLSAFCLSGLPPSTCREWSTSIIPSLVSQKRTLDSHNVRRSACKESATGIQFSVMSALPHPHPPHQSWDNSWSDAAHCQNATHVHAVFSTKGWWAVWCVPH